MDTYKGLYHEILIDHYRRPRNCGVLAHYNLKSGRVNPSCGDEVSLQGFVVHNRLEQIMFEGKGCILSQAAASLFTEHIKGMTLDAIKKITNDDMRSLIGIELGPTRLRCILLSLEALHQAIIEFEQQAC